jgi:hypothetical protein
MIQIGENYARIDKIECKFEKGNLKRKDSWGENLRLPN